MTFTTAPLPAAKSPQAIARPKPSPGPYARPSRRNPWLPKACIYKGRAAYWVPGEAWINDQFGRWLPADDVAIVLFGAFVPSGHFIRAFPALPMLPDEAFSI